MQTIVPICAIIATRNRAESLSQTLHSLLRQDLLPAEIILVDASTHDATKHLVYDFRKRLAGSTLVQWIEAEVPGAASQRNQGVACATQPLIWFFDDDVIFEPQCAERLWHAIESDRQLGGVNAMIVNQRYQPPGFVSRAMFTLMHGRREKSFAGKVIGPAINLLPEDREDLPGVVPVEWLNTTCTIYRREALPSPPFDPFFTGYSLMEDVALSSRVGKKWKLANVRTAWIFHDSQLGEHKSNVKGMARMELMNRHYIMTRILERSTFSDYVKLAAFQTFNLIGGLRDWRNWPRLLAGKFSGLREILRAHQLSPKNP